MVGEWPRAFLKNHQGFTYAVYLKIMVTSWYLCREFESLFQVLGLLPFKTGCFILFKDNLRLLILFSVSVREISLLLWNL